jgi:hypothetical protein
MCVYVSYARDRRLGASCALAAAAFGLAGEALRCLSQ